jgi:hypothetical protein
VYAREILSGRLFASLLQPFETQLPTSINAYKSRMKLIDEHTSSANRVAPLFPNLQGSDNCCQCGMDYKERMTLAQGRTAERQITLIKRAPSNILLYHAAVKNTDVFFSISQ